MKRFLAQLPDGMARVLGTIVVVLVLILGTEAGFSRLEAELTVDSTQAPTAPTQQLHPFLLWELPQGERDVDGFEVQINRLGIRGAEPVMPKPAQTRRVVLLGADLAHGHGVPLSVRFAEVAADLLGGPRVGIEAWALAVPGYSILQLSNLLQVRGWALEPDILVICGPGPETDVEPWVEKDVLDPVFTETGLRGVLEGLASFRVLDQLFRVKLGRKASRRDALERGIVSNRIGRPRMEPKAYAEQLDAVVQAARARRVDVLFLEVPLPSDVTESVAPIPVPLYRTVFADVADRNGIPVVDTGALLRNARRPVQHLWTASNHLTSVGHEVVGEGLAAQLQKWVRGGRMMKKGSSERILSYPPPPSRPQGEP